MLNNDTGNNNIATGVQALGNNTSGSGNIALQYCRLRSQHRQ
jgi:hypothetical protein